MIVSVAALYCDQCRQALVAREGEERFDLAIFSLADIRSLAKAEGWRRVATLDVCGRCFAALPAPVQRLVGTSAAELAIKEIQCAKLSMTN